jgi:hypothetical protein
VIDLSLDFLNEPQDTQGKSKKESSETYDSTIVGEGQERTAVSTEAGQVQEAPHSTGHRHLRGIMPNETSGDDEVSCDDSTMRPGAVRIPGANATLDDEDDQSTLWTSTAAPPELAEPELMEAELALDLDEAIALGIQQTVQAAAVPVPPTAVPFRRKPWRRIVCGIAFVLILALVAILTVALLPSKMQSETASETPTTSRAPSKTPSETPSKSPAPSSSPTVNRYTPLHSFLVEYFGEGFPISETEQEALNWLAYNDSAMPMPPVPGSDYFDSLNSQLLERYIVVFFYFETGGGDWNLKGGWLSENNICDGWQGLSCLGFYGCPIDGITAIVVGEFCDLFACPSAIYFPVY